MSTWSDSIAFSREEDIGSRQETRQIKKLKLRFFSPARTGYDGDGQLTRGR